jgi:predicted acylesterase/phospholipase RssA
MAATAENLEAPLRTRRVLVMDGGGCRGVVQLRVLHEIRQRCLPHDCDLDSFALAGGTSAGALAGVACVLGGLAPDEALARFSAAATETFSWGVEGLFEGALFSRRAMETMLRETLGDAALSDRPVPRFFAVTRAPGATESILVRNYDVDRKGADGGAHGDWRLWEAGLASAAAHPYLPLFAKDGATFIDGGFGFNNPADLGLAEAERLWGLDRVQCVLSIGCASARPAEPAQAAMTAVERALCGMRELVNTATDTELVANSVQRKCAAHGIEYFRFNPPALEGVGTATCAAHRIPELLGHAEQYLSGREASEMLSRLRTLLNPRDAPTRAELAGGVRSPSDAAGVREAVKSQQSPRVMQRCHAAWPHRRACMHRLA